MYFDNYTDIQQTVWCREGVTFNWQTYILEIFYTFLIEKESPLNPNYYVLFIFCKTGRHSNELLCVTTGYVLNYLLA